MDMAEAELFPCGASLDNLRYGMRLRFRDEKPPSRLERRFLLYSRSFGGA
jgi:hypothetical protein